MHFLTILLTTTFAISLVGCGGGSTSSEKNTSPSANTASSLSSSNSVSSTLNNNTVSSVSSSTSQALSVAVDAQVNKLMKSTGATAVMVAFAKNGRIVYEQAYGYKDAKQTIPLTNDALMRTASIIKPVTAAAIRKLNKQGVLELYDHAFCTGSNAPCWLPSNLLSPTTDNRVKDINIRDLIEHSAGWYTSHIANSLDNEIAIRDSLGLSGPPSREDIVRYVMKLPLDYTPHGPAYGISNYSNFGYLLLGMIIEQAAHTSYVEYVQKEILAPLGIPSTELKVAAGKLIDHDPREPVYIASYMCPSIYEVGREAPCSEEAVDTRNWVSVGLTISNARTMALFAQAYVLPSPGDFRFSGAELLPGRTVDGYHNGGTAGTRTLLRQLTSGVSYAIFTNIDFNLDAYASAFDNISELVP